MLITIILSMTINLFIDYYMIKKYSKLEKKFNDLLENAKENNLCTVPKEHLFFLDECDICGNEIYMHQNYCSGCGAYIVKVKEK